MPITALQLKAVVTADMSDAEEGLRRVRKEADSASGESGGGGLKGFLSNVAGFVTGGLIIKGAGAAFGFLKDNIGDMVTSGMQGNQVLAQLAAGLKSTHDASGMTMDSLDKLSTSIMNNTGIDDDSVKASESMLLTFTNIGKNVFPQATQAVADLATKMANGAVPSATQMEQASIQLGKALGNPLTGFTALQRVGVTFSDTQKEQIKHFMQIGDVAGAQNVILKEMNKEFGGAAAAAGQANGGMAILTAQFDNMKQTVGQALIPIIVQLLTGLRPVVTAIGNALPGAIATVQAAFQHWQPVLTAIFTGAHQLWDIFTSALQPALRQVAAAMQANEGPGLSVTTVVKQVQGVVQQLIPFVIQAAEVFGTLAAFIMTHVVPTIMQLATFAAQHVIPVFLQVAGIVVSDVLPAVMQIWDAIATNLIPVVEKLWNLLSPILVPALSLVGSILKNVVGPALADVIQIVGFLLSKLLDLMGVLQPIINLLGNLMSGISGALGGVGKLLGGLHLPGFAAGGVTPGGPVVVGENGPEVLVPPAGSQVVPLPAGLPGLTGMGAGGGGGTIALSIPVHIAGQHVGTAVLPDLVKELRRYGVRL